jgi:hypothetical protein
MNEPQLFLFREDIPHTFLTSPVEYTDRIPRLARHKLGKEQVLTYDISRGTPSRLLLRDETEGERLKSEAFRDEAGFNPYFPHRPRRVEVLTQTDLVSPTGGFRSLPHAPDLPMEGEPLREPRPEVELTSGARTPEGEPEEEAPETPLEERVERTAGKVQEALGASEGPTEFQRIHDEYTQRFFNRPTQPTPDNMAILAGFLQRLRELGTRNTELYRRIEQRFKDLRRQRSRPR